MSALKSPRRVLVNANGASHPPHVAKAEFGVQPEIVFVREDGWSLGSPKELEAVAYEIWKSSWLWYYRVGDNQLSPIADYRKEQS